MFSDFICIFAMSEKRRKKSSKNKKQKDYEKDIVNACDDAHRYGGIRTERQDIRHCGQRRHAV